jgi:hypothetical protein
MKWVKQCPGVYDSEDGRFEMYRIEGVYPPAWNVDWNPSEVERQIDRDPENVTYGSFDTIVDGARTMADAIAIFEDEAPSLAPKVEA